MDASLDAGSRCSAYLDLRADFVSVGPLLDGTNGCPCCIMLSTVLAPWRARFDTLLKKRDEILLSLSDSDEGLTVDM
jgi:hypothetical protein